MTMSLFNSDVEEQRFSPVQLFQLTSNHLKDDRRFAYLKDGNEDLSLLVGHRSGNLILRFIETQPIDSQVTITGAPQSYNTHDNLHKGNNSNKNNNNNNGGQMKYQTNNQQSFEGLRISDKIILELVITQDSICFPFGKESIVINCETTNGILYMAQFNDNRQYRNFIKIIERRKSSNSQSIFDRRTDIASSTQYFQFYGYLAQQQNMMQDYVRTATYQRAILANMTDFKDKVVLDVGAGSGILSFFAVQAGAKKVYAVEASSMARNAQLLVQSNNLAGSIEVIGGKIEDIELPEPVDVIISEPMGYMLINERMLETYLHAKKWLRSDDGSLMFPSRGDLHVAPFTDALLYLEQSSKANFWFAKDFHGVDLRALHSTATDEYFKQPIVDTFDVGILMAKSIRHIIDFQASKESDLHCITIPLEFISNQTAQLHGLAFWFDVAFIGSSQTVWLSTAPSQPLTHWYQVRCLLTTPLLVNKGQRINGTCVLRANNRQSYDVDIEVFIKETGARSSNCLDLKNPFFRYTGQPVQNPPGANEFSPSEFLWNVNQYDPQQQQQQQHHQQQHQQQAHHPQQQPSHPQQQFTQMGNTCVMNPQSPLSMNQIIPTVHTTSINPYIMQSGMITTQIDKPDFNGV